MRTKITGQLSASAAIGFVAGPILGVPLAALNIQFGPLHLDENTAPGYLVVLTFISMFIFTAYLFHSEPNPSLQPLHNHSSLPFLHPTLRVPPKPNQIGLYVCLVLFFIHFLGFAIQESITTPFVTNYYEWDEEQVFYLFAAAGILSAISFAILGFLTGKISDLTLLLASTLLGLTGYLLLVQFGDEHYGIPRFLLGFALISIAFPFGRALVLSVFSQVIGPYPQGQLIGQMFAIGAIGRISGPFWAVEALIYGGPTLIFGGAAIVFAMGFFTQIVFWKQISPYVDTALPETPPRLSFSSPRFSTPIIRVLSPRLH